MNNFLILHQTVLLYRFMHNMSIFSQTLSNLANTRMCLNNMSMSVCHHFCNFGFVIEITDIFLSGDHILKCHNLNGHIF